MLQKFTTSLLLVLMIFSFSNSYSRDNRGREVRATKIDGSEVGIANKNFNTVNNTDTYYRPLTTNSFAVSFTALGIASNYDLQSNATANEVWQDPIAPNYVHAAFMNLPTFGGTRFVVYYLSTDRGLTWSGLGNIVEAQTGFPSIAGFPAGNAIISAHSTAGALAAARTQFFVDQGQGFGLFDRLDPGLNGTASDIWGRVLVFPTGPVKFMDGSSVNGATTTSTITCSNATPPGTFSPWVDYAANQAEVYTFALGADGRLGNAYVTADAINQGGISYRESMDGGLTWGTPSVVFTANIAADSLGCLRGLSMTMIGNTPCVTYELGKITTTGYFPGLPSSIMFWSPAVNGGVPKVVASQSNIPFAPNSGPNPGVFLPLTRPAIGKTDNATSHTLYLAVNAATSVLASDSSTYYATYFMVSYDGGTTWGAPERITPTTPLKDWRYVSISRTSSLKTGSASLISVQLLIENHDYAGAFSPNQPPGPTDAISVKVDVPLIGIKEVNSTVPSGFALQQNFPNPFNPTTAIRFDIQKSSNVTLKVYNSNGQEVATLINNELVTPGTKEVTFGGSDLSSGIYFYTLFAGDFKETKKMMLIK